MIGLRSNILRLGFSFLIKKSSGSLFLLILTNFTPGFGSLNRQWLSSLREYFFYFSTESEMCLRIRIFIYYVSILKAMAINESFIAKQFFSLFILNLTHKEQTLIYLKQGRHWQGNYSPLKDFVWFYGTFFHKLYYFGQIGLTVLGLKLSALEIQLYNRQMSQITSRAISTMLAQCKGTRSKFIVEAYNPKVKKEFIKVEISDGVDTVRAVIHVQNQKLDLIKVGKPFGDKSKYLIQITDFTKFEQENLVILEIKNFIPLDPPITKSQRESTLKSSSKGILKIEGDKQIKTYKKETAMKYSDTENSSEIEITFEEEKKLQSLSLQKLKTFQKIGDLYQFFAGWEIVVRVVEKSYKEFINKSGKLTKIFQMTLIDRTGTKIQGVMFGDDAKEHCQKIKENCVYRMSRGQVRQDNFRNNREGNYSRFNIAFSRSSRFIQIANNEYIPDGNCVLTSLEDAANQKDMTKLYSIPVILLSIGQERILEKEDQTIIKKNITVGDPESKKSMDIIIWNRADRKQINPDHLIQQVILLKNFKLNTYRDSLYLNSVFKSEIIPLPKHHFNQSQKNLKESDYLSLTGSVNNQFRPRQETKTIQQLQQEITRHDFTNGALYSDLKVFITYINLNGKYHYDACCNIKCNKTAEEASKCIHCGQYNNTIKRKFNIRIQVSDYTGSLGVTAFDDFALQIFKGLSVDQLIRMGEDEQSEEAQKRLYQQFDIRLYTNNEFERGLKHKVIGKVRDVQTVKTSIQNISKIRELL